MEASAYDMDLERKEYRRRLFVTAGKVAAVLLFLMVIMQLLAYGITLLLQGLQVVGVVIPSGIQTYLLSYFPCLLADLFAIWLGVVFFMPRWRECCFSPIPSGKGSLVFNGTVATLGASMVAMTLVSLGILLLEELGHPLVMPDMSMPRDSVLAAMLYLAYVCLIGPFLEEVIFRGILLKALLPYGKMAAVVASSVLFGLFHGNPLQLFTGFLVGLLLGFLVVETGSIWPAVLAHIFNNSFVTIPEVLFPGNETFYTLWNYAHYGIGGLALILLLLRYGKRFAAMQTAKDSRLLRSGQKVVWMLIHPVMLIYLLVYGALCLAFCLLYIA